MLTPEASPVPPTSAAPASAFSSPPRARGEVILVADDQDSVRHLLDTVLSDHGYRTLLAADGQQAIAQFNLHAAEIAAVVTDMHMPNLSGESLADNLRRMRPDVPVLFMSGLGSGETGQALRPANSRDPFLLKPFRPVALLEALHRLLHEPRKKRA